MKTLAELRKAPWASIGALITVLVLALDPSVQQLIRLSSRVVYQDGRSLTLQRALDASRIWA